MVGAGSMGNLQSWIVNWPECRVVEQFTEQEGI